MARMRQTWPRMASLWLALRHNANPLPLSTLNQYYATSSPADPRNLELSLRDPDAKGYLDLELVYRWRQKESLRSVKQKIVRKIQQNESAYSFEESVLSVLAEAF
jgi:hypothetical protein